MVRIPDPLPRSSTMLALRILLPALGLLAHCAPAAAVPTPFEFSLLQSRQDVSNTSANTSSHNDQSPSHSGSHVASARKSILVDFPIHESCNASQALQIRSGLDDMKLLLQSSIHHLLLHGNDSELFQLYFGADADPAVPLGYYSRILSVSKSRWTLLVQRVGSVSADHDPNHCPCYLSQGDKTGTLFRCDDIDGNCQFPEWNGHWRGNK